MVELKDKSNCCGCTSCESVCPHKAITMIPDEQGFVYPNINPDLCTECKLCVKACPFITKPIRDDVFAQRLLGLRLRDKESLANSQSGGMFQVLASKFIEEGGIVYGVSFDNGLKKVRHIRVCDKESLVSLLGSKYVQSDLNGIYLKVANDLKAGNRVLLSGVGCQVAGLISFCKVRKIPMEGLLTVDLICYGVPSPKYFEDYLKYIEHTTGSKVDKYCFRDKIKFGWRDAGSSILLADGRKIYPTRNFYESVLHRRSCSKCPFTSFERSSDFTIGDFWGIEKVKSEWANDDNGVSLVMINTLKGEQFFKEIENCVDYFTTTKSECVQPQLRNPHPLHPDKDAWEKTYAEKGFKAACKKVNIITKPNPIRVYLGGLKSKLFSVLRNK